MADLNVSAGNIFVFLDIGIDKLQVGRIIIELFENIAPKTVDNFRALCTGEKGLGKNRKPLHYKGCKFHRIVPQCFAQAGDIINNNGTSGESIYNEAFEVENYKLHHNQEGMVGMAKISDTNLVSSQFYITVSPYEQLDGISTIFGKVKKGLDIIKDFASIDREGDYPLQDIVITDCGELKEGDPWNIHISDETDDVYPPWPNDWDNGKDKVTVQRAISSIREAGNFHFSKKNYLISQRKYSKVLRYIDWYQKSDLQCDNMFISNCKAKTLLNLAAVQLKRKCYKEALNYCNQCEIIDSNNGKLYYRKAQARLGMRDIDEALEDLRKALSLSPNNKTIKDFLKLAKSDKLLHLKREREFFSKVFK